jgi:hypothetical protein
LWKELVKYLLTSGYILFSEVARATTPTLTALSKHLVFFSFSSFDIDGGPQAADFIKVPVATKD